MADKLHFSLVSPERELFAGEVDQVDAPGSEGDYDHLPEAAFYMVGGIAEAVAKAEKMASEA